MNEFISKDDYLKALLRSDFRSFLVKTFTTVSAADTYLHNWHIDAILYELNLIVSGKNRKLVINQPPRSLKSICVSVALVAWWLGKDPSKRFTVVSYSNELAATFQRQFRKVVESEWYKALFPAVKFDKFTETEAETTRGGSRFAASVDGTLTGKGADVIIIDDPMKAADANSETALRRVNEFYSSTLLSRFNNKQTGALILVMQRLHEDDLSAKVLKEEECRHLVLSAIAEDDEVIQIGPDKFYHRWKGEVLNEAHEPLSVYDDMKQKMGSIAFSTQYQQTPIPLEGNIVRREWFKTYEKEPVKGPGVQIIQSWDIATATGVKNDYSVCTTWAKVKREYYLLHVWRGRLEFPKLRRKVIELAKTYEPNAILIEKAGPGLQMIQELVAKSINDVPRPIGIHPHKDKVTRMSAQSSRFEAGQVFLPTDAPWLADLYRELLGFPNTKHDDQVDSVSQFLNWAEKPKYKATVATGGLYVVH